MSPLAWWLLAVVGTLVVVGSLATLWLVQRHLQVKYADAHVWHLPGGSAVARLGHTDEMGRCYVVEVRPKRGPVTIVYSPPAERLARLAAERALTTPDRKALP